MRLGDLGADVVKVERPSVGDESRAWGPPFDDRGESAYFLCCNRNKLSVAADLSQPADRAVILRLLADADVVVDNFLPGTLAKWGLEPAPLLAAHPRLIWCTITGFGPDAARPGYDYVVQAESGWMSVTGAPDGEPMRAGMALADVLTGKDALIAITAALLRYGLAAENIAWLLVFAFAPISGIYYPISTLPDWLQPFAWALPSSHVFEGMRAVLLDGAVPWSEMAWASALNVAWVAGACWLFAHQFRAARIRGALLNGGE